MKQLMIIGASGHGKVVADIAKKNGYDVIYFLDDNENIMECGGYPVIGRSCDYTKYDCDMFVAIGNARIRQKIQEQLNHVITLIHPNAVIAENVEIGIGTAIMAGAVINPETMIGKGCIINTCASVDHDCTVNDYAHISVGAHIAGTCYIGERTWIGAGATVSNNINICGDCMIGAGATVIKNIEYSGKYIGVPAENIKLPNGGGGKTQL
ncbi:MAG: acetyltransferase [Eubacteriales bacterium]|nr:acetyltransferase [Eubacteriales bacterium]